MAKKEIGRPQTAHIAPFGLRMQPDLKERIEAAAVAAGRSMNAEIVARLSEGMDRSLEYNASAALARADKLIETQDRLLSVAGYYLTVLCEVPIRQPESRLPVELIKALGAAIANRDFESVVAAAAVIVDFEGEPPIAGEPSGPRSAKKRAR